MDPPRTVRRHVLRATTCWLLLATLAGLAYARAIPLGPFSDDHWLLAFARHGSFDISWFHIKPNSWTPFHRPFVLGVWKALGGVFGDAAPAYRLWLLGTHAVNASLVALLVRQGVPGSRGLAWSVSALFLLAPAPEVLIWLSGLYDATATLGYLGTLLCAARYWRTGHAGWLVLSLIACQLSAWSKESAFVLPAVLALVAWWVPRRPPLRRLLWLVLPCALIIAANLGQRYLAWHSLGGNPLGSPSVATLVRRLADGFLFAVVLVPTALFRFPFLLPPLALLVVVLAAGWFSGRHRRTLLFGAAWFVLSLLPGLVLLDPVLLERYGQNSRFLYLPGIGAAIAVGASLFGACDRWLPGRPRVPWAATGLICGIQVAVLQVHIGAWQIADRAVRAIPASVHRVVPSLPPFTCLQVVNLPKHHNGAYIYWIGLDAALLSRYGMVVDQYCGGAHTPLAIDDPRAEDGIFQVELATDEQLHSWDVASARGVLPREPRVAQAEHLAMRTRYSFAGLMDIPELVERAIARPAGASGSTAADWASSECRGPGAWVLSSFARCQSGGGVLVSATPASIELPARTLTLPAWAEVIVSIRILGDRGGPGQASVRWKDRHGGWRTDGTREIALPRRAGAFDLHFFIAPRAHDGTIAQLALDIASADTPVAIDRISVHALP